MRKTLFICLVFITVLVTGCNDNYPIYQSCSTEDNEWYVEVEGKQYVLWPDQNWILINAQNDKKIGYLDTKKTSLYLTKNDEDNIYLQVGESGADLIHVPLVQRELSVEFSLNNVDGIEWSKWGIKTEDLGEKIYHKIIEEKEKVSRFVSFAKETKESSLEGEWVRVGTIYCYNNMLQNVVYPFNVKYYNGILQCGGYNTYKYFLISRNEMEEILGYKIDI